MSFDRASLPTGAPVTPSSVSVEEQQPQKDTLSDTQPQPKRALMGSISSRLYPPATPQQPRLPYLATYNSIAGLEDKSTAGGVEVLNTTTLDHTAAQTGEDNANKIWSTRTTEERERIKDFWLGLGEQERRNLVKIEKDTVLKKMKEQQKHGCSCAVCGRKRLVTLPHFFPNAIEEELEVLYDAYYEELEQYANYQQRYVSSGGAIPPPPGPGSVELGEYEDGNADEEDDDDRPEEKEREDKDIPQLRPGGYYFRTPLRRGAVMSPAGRRRNVAGKDRDGLSNIGSSLTLTGPRNILTVADDLLKTDGQKFLEMMEQLAERRMQRVEDAAIDVDDESDEESERGGSDVDGDDSDDRRSDEEDEDDDEEEEGMMTEEQKMEEGKRMFSIFAARMFEQRVLQAYREYREKVAQERRKQLLHEREEEHETTLDREMEQFQNQKKDWQQQKQAKEEEKTQTPAEEAQRSAKNAAEESPEKANQEAFTARNMEPPVRPGRNGPSSAGILTNAHVGTINGGTFVNVAHIYESDLLPAQGGGLVFPIAVLGLQAVSFASRSHYPHCDHLYNSLPLLIPDPMASTSSLVLHLPSLYQDMRTVFGPVATLWLLVKTLVRWRRSIEHH